VDEQNRCKIENQEQQLTYLAEVHQAGKPLGGNHEPIIDKHIRNNDHSIKNQPYIDEIQKKDNCQGIDESKQRPIYVQPDWHIAVQSLIREESELDQIHYMIISST
jgi:hypothetical protein